MIEIDNVIVLEDVITVKFTCDIAKCKGACCTLESSYGAPIKESEIPQIEEIIGSVLPLLSQRAKDIIEENGFWEIKQNDYFIRSVENKDCVFVYYDNGAAKCAIEKLYFDRKVKYRKPISCHLFPIRIAEFGGDVLRYEVFSECRHALEKGRETGLSVGQFCEDSLKRKYGEEWFKKFSEYFERPQC